jgi:hypothetical protein
VMPDQNLTPEDHIRLAEFLEKLILTVSLRR